MALPGVQRLDHIGFTVPNLAEAEDFLVNVLGCEYMYPLGPFVHEDSDWMLEHLNVHPRTVMRRLHFFRLGGQAVFEVFEYEAPDQQTQVPKNSDIGGHHVALYVDDLDAAMRMAAEEALWLMTEHEGLSRDEAYSLASVAVDLGITQVVDGVLGCHAAIRRDLFSA